MGERGAAMADSVGLAFHLDVAKIKQKAVEDGRRQAERVRRVLRR
jgi:membrane protein